MMTDQQINTLLGDYGGQATIPDEVKAGKEIIQPHWEQLLQQVLRLGEEEVRSRNIEIQRILRESGVTYNVYGQLELKRRIWEMDPIPFLISPKMWKEIHSGILQRAKLMDMIFKDLYGERKLFKEGILPPELILMDRHFLRACDQMYFGEKAAILQYGVDISRGPSGQLWVIGDRTQAPSGMAYAMENRVTLARVMPELFTKAKVKKIVPFYQSIRENLLHAAPQGGKDPLVVLLSPGPYNATYFEHAFLASLQGFQLVQGQDLMVKDNYVWLKTLNGLEQVDVIVRHVDDDYSDPLSLRPDSQLGVAGLLEAARHGNVTLANPLGSGVLENPGLMAFMPSICKYFLKEDLKLPNIASWWCGQKKELQYVVDNLDKLVIKDIRQRRGNRTAYGWELSRSEKKDLIARIKSKPNRFVGQEQAIFSTVPAWGIEGLEPRKTVLRCFASAAEDSFIVMPGGLSRSAPSAGNSHVSNRSGGIGKDTWVISDEKVQPIRYNPREQFDVFSYFTTDCK